MKELTHQQSLHLAAILLSSENIRRGMVNQGKTVESHEDVTYPLPFNDERKKALFTELFDLAEDLIKAHNERFS